MLLLACTTSCDLDYNPIDSYSDITEGVQDNTGSDVIFKDKASVESHLQGMYKLLRDRQEHWYLDKLLIGDAHADNAYGGTTGAEVIPFENNSIDGANSVLKRDWDRFMEDIAVSNRLIVGVDQISDLSDQEREYYKAQGKIFRAMIMFEMVRIWGAFPVITSVPGDITSDNIEDMYPVYFPSQNTEEEAYQQIENCLLYTSDAADD